MITQPQLRCIQALLSKLRLQQQRKDIILGASAGRTESSKELTMLEAKALIQYLKSQDPEEHKAEKMRRKIISMAHEMQWTLPNDRRRVDIERLDAWMVKSSYLHKKLNQYRYEELPALITQFQKVYQSFLKGI